jgi:bacterioferritin
MKGDPKVLKMLQASAASEAQLILQCRLDARTLKYMGLKSLACKLNKLGKNSQAYLKEVTDRILLLQGDASCDVASVQQQTSLTALLKNQRDLQMAVMAPYSDGVVTARTANDDGTRNVFHHLLKWHEDDIGWIERQLALVNNLGESNYIAAKI